MGKERCEGMVITCGCGARLKIIDDKLTAAGVRVKCPKCGVAHLAKRGQEAVQPSAPSMPWFAPASPRQDEGGDVPLVLVAHDSSVVADMITGTLQRAGMRTDYAPNGLEALRKATELRPQAMVVDVGLTGIYGFELCERLKGSSDTRSIKIILLSSVYGLTAYKRAPVTLYGADDYIEKHHIPDQLADRLRRLLSGEAAAVQPPVAGAQREAEEDVGEAPGRPLSPLISRKGIAQPRPGAAEDSASGEAGVPPHASGGDIPAAPPERSGPRPWLKMPEAPSILPRTPVTLDASRGVRSTPVGPVSTEPIAALPETGRDAAPQAAGHPPLPAQDDGSIRLDAAFFEHEEYTAPEAGLRQAPDPEEVEKAKRFARIIVSDIALYNQDAVEQGIRNGTFGELLKEDIAEGRTLYDSRVPVAIRASKDYLQEAFDDFIAAKKKLR